VGGESIDRKQLAGAMRSAACRAADLSSGGVSFVFESADAPADDLQLRAASGFSRPEEAKEAAEAILGAVRDAIKGGAAVGMAAPDGLDGRAAGGLHIVPLRQGETVHGALATTFPASPAEATTRAVTKVANDLGIRLDHARLEAECASLRNQLVERPDPGDDKSDEVLKLSEALFAQDIELLRSNEKLGKIERLKNDFIEKMSRELRTPLNSIIEAIIAVMTSENDSLSEASKSTLRSSLDEGTAFLRTLQNILDLWRIKQGELPVETQDVNFRELVDEAIFSVQDGLGDKPLRIEPRLSEPFPRIRTDLAKVSQILFLLLDNAAKFTPAGEIEINASVEEGRLCCTVRDTGIGICPDDQQFIFDEFYQVDEPSSHKYRGAGLGLTLVRDLVLLLEGEVMVSSDAGRGTTVTFRIPLV
jgi:signal transduction histidine kinase